MFRRIYSGGLSKLRIKSSLPGRFSPSQSSSQLEVVQSKKVLCEFIKESIKAQSLSGRGPFFWIYTSISSSKRRTGLPYVPLVCFESYSISSSESLKQENIFIMYELYSWLWISFRTVDFPLPTPPTSNTLFGGYKLLSCNYFYQRSLPAKICRSFSMTLGQKDQTFLSLRVSSRISRGYGCYLSKNSLTQWERADLGQRLSFCWIRKSSSSSSSGIEPWANCTIFVCSLGGIEFFNIKMKEVELKHYVTRKLKEWEISPGGSVYDHLVRLLETFFSQKNTYNKLDHLELLSEFLKKNAFQYRDYLEAQQLNKLLPQTSNTAQLLKKITTAVTLTRLPHSQIRLQGVRKDMSLLQQVGFQLSDLQLRALQTSMIKVSRIYECKQLRFWGKMLGQQDYFVLQGKSGLQYDDRLEQGQQKRKQGVNYYTYWVTNSLISQWRELPLVTPAQLKASRLVKYLFSGDLEKTLNCFPVFPGKEKHLLKCQIARITHCCELAPQGLLKLAQDPKEVQFQDQFKLGELGQIGVLQKWVHLNLPILKLGRCTHFVSQTLPQAKREALQAQLTQTDPESERLKPITQDKPVDKAFQANWLLKTSGQSQLYNNLEGNPVSYGIMTLRNLCWSGWLTAASRNGWVNCYVGYGAKSYSPAFNPLSPEDIQTEVEQIQEFGQPNPKEPPDEVQSDSDQEAKKEDEP